MVFVFRSESLKDEDSLLDGGGLDLDGLKAAFQGGVFFDVLAVLVQSGGADALEFAAAQGGLDDVRGVHRAFGGTGADYGVQLVNEQNDVLGAPDFIHDGLDALLELSAILGAGDHKGEVEGDHAFVAKEFGHVAGRDLLGKALDDGSLADASLTQENRIILGAAAEDLNDAFDLVFAADDRVHLALAGDFGQVAAKSFEGRSLHLAFFSGGRLLRRLARGLLLLGGKIRIQFLENLLAGLLDVHVRFLRTRAATPSPSRSKPSRMCSVPT